MSDPKTLSELKELKVGRVYAYSLLNSLRSNKQNLGGYDYLYWDDTIAVMVHDFCRDCTVTAIFDKREEVKDAP